VKIADDRIDTLLEIEPETNFPENNLPGLSGTTPDVSYAFLKADLAKVKHGSAGKHLTKEQKKMVLVPTFLTQEGDSDDGTVANMVAYWERDFGKVKKPWHFNRVFFDGSVNPHRTEPPHERLGWHGIAIELRFNDIDDPDSIEIWDSGHFMYDLLTQRLVDWLVAEGYDITHGIDLAYHDDDIPFQRDPYNCGQYAIYTLRFLFRWWQPVYTGLDPKANEAEFYHFDPNNTVWQKRR
jgi:hypothetical protein